ncbi:MAG: hypothetical protein U0L18_02320 [Acutalibacteraceae bacterium]|nr:hypothetical protein [Acutalibacteraceae bacterium]
MMNKIKNLSKKTKVILLAVCLIVIAGIGSVITACTNAKPDDGADENKAVATESVTESTEQATEEVTEDTTEEPTEQATENPTEEVTEQPTEKPTEKKDKENKKEEATIVQTTTTIVGDNQNNSSNNNSNNSTTNNTDTGTATQSKPVNNDKPNNTTTTPSKVWHEAEYKTVHHLAETKKVWVVDQEGYTYEEPVYETHGVTICNGCGADITSNLDEHMKTVHIPNRELPSYRDEWREVQVGTKTITVEEKGHWETQVVKEAWDEQILIKEAGYY